MMIDAITEQTVSDAGMELYDLGYAALEAGVGDDAVEYQRRLFAGADLLRRIGLPPLMVEAAEAWGEKLRVELRARGIEGEGEKSADAPWEGGASE